MQETAKNLAATLKGALASKGIDLKLGQALDVMALISGTKDWNALTASLKLRRSNLAMRHAIQGLLDAARQLADEAGDTPEWNDGGYAREACKVARTALTSAPDTEPLDGTVNYEMTPDCVDRRLWIGVDNIAVYIRRNDEGVSVDLYPNGAEDGDSLAGTWALFQDAEADDPAAGNEAFPQTWIIYSRSEADASDDAGYWSNEFGWSTREFATTFGDMERNDFELPLSAGIDAEWIGLLKPFRVSLTEAGEQDPILFDCCAENAGHAEEQATNAYPGCEVHLAEVASTSRASPLKDHVRKVYDLIAAASAWRIDASELITDMSQDSLRDDPENEVFHFTWTDAEDHLYSETLAESDLAAAVIEADGILSFPDADGGPMKMTCYRDGFASEAREAVKPESHPHICGLDGEHDGDCPACEEARIYARDLTAEWVGQHYGVNFDAESAAKQDDWIARFMDAHSSDNPLFPLRDWEYEVSNGDTRVGYAEWLAGQLESRHDDREMGLLDDDDE